MGAFFLYSRFVKAESKKFKVVFMDVGQGDAALVRFEDGQKMLVDCGIDKNILSSLGRNMFFFDRTIDYLLISHPDLDHYGGCVDVLKNYHVKNIVTNGKEKNDQYYYELKNAIKNESASVVIINGNKKLAIASSSLQFFSPDDSITFSKYSDNNFSLVFKLVNGNASYLFTGDMEIELENILAEKYCIDATNCVLRSNILKVAHHGSDSSSGELFLSLVRPKQAVISVGKNSYGHPSLRTLRHLERAGAELLRTDKLGDIITE